MAQPIKVATAMHDKPEMDSQDSHREREKTLVGYSLTSTWIPQNMHQATQEVNKCNKKY